MIQQISVFWYSSFYTCVFNLFNTHNSRQNKKFPDSKNEPIYFCPKKSNKKKLSTKKKYHLNHMFTGMISTNSHSYIYIICQHDEKLIIDKQRVFNQLTPIIHDLLQEVSVNTKYVTFAKDFDITASALNGVITFLCTGYVSIQLDTMVRTIEKLGGSVKLDNYLKLKVQNTLQNPQTPREDHNQLYHWRIEDACADLKNFIPTEAIHSNSVRFWFRKLKSDNNPNQKEKEKLHSDKEVSDSDIGTFLHTDYKPLTS
jgi:hypothetical protein